MNSTYTPKLIQKKVNIRLVIWGFVMITTSFLENLGTWELFLFKNEDTRFFIWGIVDKGVKTDYKTQIHFYLLYSKI